MLAITSLGSASDRSTYCGTARWESFIDEAASRFGLSPSRVRAVILAESAGCEAIEGRPTTSSAGAMGLMQLMPATWASYRERLQLGVDPHDPRENILAGSAYLRDLSDRFGWPGACIAYHAGPARYEEYLSSGRPLPRATVTYLTRIEQLLDGMTPTMHPDDFFARTLFVTRKRSEKPPSPITGKPTTEALFVTLRSAPSQAENRDSEPPDVQEK